VTDSDSCDWSGGCSLGLPGACWRCTKGVPVGPHVLQRSKRQPALGKAGPCLLQDGMLQRLRPVCMPLIPERRLVEQVQHAHEDGACLAVTPQGCRAAQGVHRACHHSVHTLCCSLGSRSLPPLAPCTT